MHRGPKIFIAFSALLCAVAFFTLGRLAFQTTAPPVRATLKPRSLDSLWGGGGRDVAAGAPSGSLLPSAGDVSELMRKLLELANAPGTVPGELLLTFKSRAALDAFRARAAERGIRVLHQDPRLLSARVSYSDPALMAQELAENASSLENIGMNYTAWIPALQRVPETDTANAGGTVPFRDSGLEAIGAAGDRSSWGKGVTVAVLDTGITEHPALSHVPMTRMDLVKDGQEPAGHGTAMATLIAGNDPTFGGVAPASRLLDIRVADSNGESNTALVAQGIMAAVDQGAKLINISLGTHADSLTLRRAVEYAAARGVVVVAAAGNEQASSLSFPAAYSGVISVAAVDAQGRQAFFSNSGDGLFISAPGVGIVTGYSNQATVISSGTSQATALVSGVISAVFSRGEYGQSITRTLSSTAKPTGLPATQTGAGIVQVPW